MNADMQKILRAPFPPESIGKLPRITCPKCRDARSKNCDEHQKSRCDLPDGSCNNWITPRHLHLGYVGHAAVTDRLLQADPAWTWEPLAFDEQGLPAVDRHGGLWIRLTVAGVTRLGYGDAQGKTGPDAVKEAIGDALRNASMRFGVALDLWHKDGHLESADTPAAPPAQRNGQPKPPQQRNTPPAESGPVSATAARQSLAAVCDENNWDLDRVAARYRAQYKEELGHATDGTRITAFTKLLYGVPQAELKSVASA